MKSQSKYLFKLFTVFAVLISLFGSAVTFTPARADSTILVNTTVDENNTGPNCSLREAITAANTNAAYGGCPAGSGIDTITIPAATYTLTIEGTGEDLNATGDLDILDDVTINGAGANNTIIQAGTIGYPGASNGIDRVMQVSVPPTHLVKITGVTIANGKTTSAGGGIWVNGGTLTVENSVFSGNSASDIYGGGAIYNTSDDLNVIASAFVNNFAANGGAIANYSTLNVTNSTFSANVTSGLGGAIDNFVTTTAIIRNSTFSGNIAPANSSGIYNESGTTLWLWNSLLANNSGSDCYKEIGTTVSGNNNLIETDGAGACGTTSPINGIDPQLGPLTGSPAYFPIDANSPAFNAGDDTVCAAAPVSNTSLNGATRPQGAHCDIGSYEKAPIFADVSLSYWSNTSIERLYNAGITAGCSAIPLNYCPTNQVTRAQMAIFLLRGMHGSAYTPPAATGTIFTDVPLGTFGAAWIEQLATEGITSGCGGGNYCPTQTVSRAQMAIFLVRAKHGVAFVPPTATGIFPDVPVGSFGANYIEQLVADAITSGCGGGNYCPNTMVKRDSMAVFLVKTFNLP